MLEVCSSAMVGCLIGMLVGCLPGLHVYNLLALGVVVMQQCGAVAAEPVLIGAVTGSLVGFAIASTIPSIFLAAPDESALFTVLPGQDFLMRGRGLQAVWLTTWGGIWGLILLAGVVWPLAMRVLPALLPVVRPHFHWMLWCTIAFMLMSEWPKGGHCGQGGWWRFADGWKSPGMGLVTFFLAGLLGMILFYRPPLRLETSFQNLMPAFVGLFTIPGLLMNLFSRMEIPAQMQKISFAGQGRLTAPGVLAGLMGGLFAVLVPGVTGGVGGMLAGHAVAQRDGRVFLISQGVCRVVYFIGGWLLFFAPGVRLTRGGAAGMMSGFTWQGDLRNYIWVLAAVLIAGTLACVCVIPAARGMLRVIRRTGYRRISLVTLLVAIGLVWVMTGVMGLLVLLTATGIGLLPLLCGARRMNALGVILLPLALNLSGLGPVVAQWLGLVDP